MQAAGDQKKSDVVSVLRRDFVSAFFPPVFYVYCTVIVPLLYRLVRARCTHRNPVSRSSTVRCQGRGDADNGDRRREICSPSTVAPLRVSAHRLHTHTIQTLLIAQDIIHPSSLLHRIDCRNGPSCEKGSGTSSFCDRSILTVRVSTISSRSHPAFASRLSNIQVQTKKRQALSKRFKCPFCANEETVECKMDFRAGIGSLACRLCAASYQMPIHHLHEPVDVFSEWLDDCEAAAQGKTSTSQQPPETAVPRYESEDDDDELPAASGLTGTKKKAAAAPASKPDARPSYTDLGLDDSDDDSDDD